MALSDEGARELPTKDALAAEVRKQVSGSVVEAALLERNSKVAIRYRTLTEDEIKSGEDLDNRNALGFHIPKMWDKILDIKKCHLQEDPSNAIRNEIRAFANANNLTFFNPRNHEGLLRTLMIRTASTGEIMVVIQFFEDDSEKRNLLLNFLVEKFPGITSLQYVINQKANDTLYDQNVLLYSGQRFIGNAEHFFAALE